MSREDEGGEQVTYEPSRYPGVPVPADWVCAFVACGRRADQPHVTGCPYDREAEK